MSAFEAEVVLLATADWNAPLWTNKQYVARELAAAHDVLYVESLGLRRPEISVRDLRRVINRMTSTHRDPHRSPPTRLEVASPYVLPFHGPTARLFNGPYMRHFWRSHLPASSKVRILWTFSPLTYSAEEYVDTAVYHCVDLLGEQPGMPRELILSEEQRLARKGVHAIGSSTRVCEHLRQVGFADVVHWPNVADASPFLAASEAHSPRRPMVVFGGNLSPYKLDVDLLEELARHLPSDTELVMAGPWAEGGGGPVRRIRHLADLGVRFPGLLSLAELAHLYASATVGIIPYQLNGYTAGVDPLKTVEYLASGLSVVATPLPSLSEDSGLVHIASGSEFVGAVVQRLGVPSPTELAARMETARTRSWAQRGVELRSLVGRLSRDLNDRRAATTAEARWHPAPGDGRVVHAAVVTYGHVADARNLLASIGEQDIRVHAAIVHNGPGHHARTGLLAELASLRDALPGDGGAVERLILVDPGDNIGYAAGLNLGLKHLENEGWPDFVLLLNADVELVRPDTLRNLIEAAAEYPDVWCWGGTHVAKHLISVDVAGFVDYNPMTGRRRRRVWSSGLNGLDGIELTDAKGRFIPGSAMLLPSEAYRNLGGLSDSYFMYYEELDLAERIRSSGHLLGWARASILAHEGQQTTASRTDGVEFVARHSTYSHLRFLRTHHRPLVPLGATLRLGRCALARFGGDLRIARGTWAGLNAYVRGRRP